MASNAVSSSRIYSKSVSFKVPVTLSAVMSAGVTPANAALRPPPCICTVTYGEYSNTREAEISCPLPSISVILRIALSPLFAPVAATVTLASF